MVKGVKVLLKKPWALIGRHLDYAAVEINRERHFAYIAMGSNMGNKEENLSSNKRGTRSLGSGASLIGGKVVFLISAFPLMQGTRWSLPCHVFCSLRWLLLSVWRPHFVLVCEERGWCGYGRYLPENADGSFISATRFRGSTFQRRDGAGCRKDR